MTDLPSDKTGARWYLVKTKPRQESLALVNLERQGYRAYLPRIRLSKRRRGVWQSLLEPLFPGYLFVYAEPGYSNLAPVRSTLGARGLVYFGDTPASLDNEAISQLREHEAEQLGDDNSAQMPGMEPGQVVRVVEGPFAGLNGVFQMSRSADRVMLLIEMLGAPQTVALSGHHIVPVES